MPCLFNAQLRSVPTRALVALPIAAMLLAAIACSTREGTLAPVGTTSSGATAGAGGTGASGGAGLVGGSGAAGASGGAGGTGGVAAAAGHGGAGAELPCDPRDLAACLGQKCTVVTDATGATGCAAAGPLSAWSVCSVNADCAAGLWCDHAASVCKPVCATVGDCSSPSALCLPAEAVGGGSIPGLRVCVADCNPMGSDCGSHANCVYLESPPLFDCVASLDHPDGDPCVSSSDCGAGLVCTAAGECRPWCDTPGDVYTWCKTGVWCCSLDPAPSYQGSALGYCACP